MKKIPIWKNLVLTISVIFVLIIATFAWFYTRPTGSANELPVDVGNAHYIQISGDEGNNWSEGLEMDIGINKKFKEISGDGINFFAPVYDFVENETGGLYTKLVSFNKINGDEYYYEQIFDFRGDTVQQIYLSPKSYVTVAGSQSNSYIDGAIRVAFFELDENGNEELKLIWAPNSAVEYSAESNSFTRDGVVEPYYCYQKSAIFVDPDSLNEPSSDIIKISTEGTDEEGCGYDQTHKLLWSNGQNMPANAPSVLTVDELGEDDKHVYKKLKVRVWLEGHDRECVSMLSGQSFTMKLQFDAKAGE